MLEINNILSFISDGLLCGILVTITVISYLILSLLNWDFIKPLKYIGISLIIVGLILIIIRFSNSFIIESILSEISIPASILGTVFKPLLIMGIFYMFIGIILIVLQNIYYKNKKEKNLTNN